MDKRKLNQNKIEDTLKNIYSKKVLLSQNKKKNLDKIINNVIELKRQKQINSHLDNTIDKLINNEYTNKKKSGLFSFLGGVAKWQIATMSVLAILFIGAGITFATPNFTQNLNVLVGNTKGNIDIKSNVIGADIYIKNKNETNFRNIGKTPIKLTLEIGEYEMYLSMNGYVTSEISKINVNLLGNLSKNINLTKLDTTSPKLVEYKNDEFGISFSHFDNDKVTFEKTNDEGFKISILSPEAIVVIQTQANTPTLLANYNPIKKTLNGTEVMFREYTYSDISQNYSKLNYLNGISSDGLLNINNYTVFIYSESLTKENMLFNSVIESFKLTKEKKVVLNEYTFNSSKIGLQFKYTDNFVYQITTDDLSSYSARLTNKTDINENVIITWQKNDYHKDPIFLNNKFEKVKINNIEAEKLEDQNTLTYLLPNNILVKFVTKESEEMKKLISLFNTTFTITTLTTSSSSSQETLNN